MIEIQGVSAQAGVQILTVSHLNRALSQVLERQFPLIWVTGEVSNLTIAASGHWYFSLKDSSAQVRAVMFRGRAQLSAFTPRNGDKLEVRAKVSFYEPRGDLQLTVEAIRRAGAGDLLAQFEATKKALATDGLLASERKRPLPTRPKRLGLITSVGAAALRDVLTALSRRAPSIEVILIPSLVQGGEAERSLLRAVHQAAELHLNLPLDALLVVRGGGSAEDLWAFNHEGLARALAAFPVPVVTGIGHETDFTIADFVADRRAATPTAAAELLSPDQATQYQQLASMAASLNDAARRGLESLWQRLDRASLRLRSPQEQLGDSRSRLSALYNRMVTHAQTQQFRYRLRLQRAEDRLRVPSMANSHDRLNHLSDRLTQLLPTRLKVAQARFAAAEQALRLVSPAGILERGYALVVDQQGHLVRTAEQARSQELLSVRFHDGDLPVQTKG